MKLEDAMLKGAMTAIGKRIAYHEGKIAEGSSIEDDQFGGKFVKKSPEATASERRREALLDLQSYLPTIDLSPPVNEP